MKRVDYICGLIDKEVEEGKVPLERIVAGFFSQGCAVSLLLLLGLLSRYKGKLGGVAGLSGYLPLSGKVGRSWSDAKEEGQSITKWFLVHSSRDQLVPKRMFTNYKEKLGVWEGDKVEAKMYEGMALTTIGAEVRDLCTWLEKVVPMA